MRSGRNVITFPPEDIKYPPRNKNTYALDFDEKFLDIRPAQRNRRGKPGMVSLSVCKGSLATEWLKKFFHWPSLPLSAYNQDKHYFLRVLQI